MIAKTVLHSEGICITSTSRPVFREMWFVDHFMHLQAAMCLYYSYYWLVGDKDKCCMLSATPFFK